MPPRNVSFYSVVNYVLLSQHLSHVHLVDAQTFNEHTVLRVPTPKTTTPRLSPPSHTLPNPASRSAPSLNIPAASARTEPNPWPLSAWCSPTNSPTTSPRAQWPSGTLLPSVHEAEVEERNRSRAHRARPHQSQSPPSTLYADLRSNVTSNVGIFDRAQTAWVVPPEVDPRMASSWPPRSFVASGISGAVYEFIPPPAASRQYAVSLDPQSVHYDVEGEDEEDKPATRPSSPQEVRDPRLQNLLITLNRTTAPLPNSTSTSSSNIASSRVRPSTHIRIPHHPATRTRAAYDEKNNCTHLSGMCFDPTGRWMYTSTEKSIAEWDVADVLGGRYAGQDSQTMWGKMVFDEGAEWA